MDRVSSQKISVRAGFAAALILSCGAMLVVSCSRESVSTPNIRARKVQSHPYGIWSTGRGHVVVVPRNGTFVYCDRTACMGGRTEPAGANSVLLKGFVDSPVTQALRTESGFDEGNIPLPGERSPEEHDLYLGNNVYVKEGYVNPCGNNPCRSIGNQERDPIRFLKIEDF